MTPNIQAAHDMAKAAHAGQMYGSFDYFEGHIEKVVNTVLTLGLSRRVFDIEKLEQATILAYLHDTIEDTDVTKEDVEAAFGMGISDGVYLLTHLENEPYDSYLNLLMQDKTTSFVKYCDARVNMEFSVFNGDMKRINKYAEIMYTINSEYNFISWG